MEGINMSLPYSCEVCARPMNSKRTPQVCASCEENSEKQFLKNEKRRQKDFVDSHIIVCRPMRRDEL